MGKVPCIRSPGLKSEKLQTELQPLDTAVLMVYVNIQ